MVVHETETANMQGETRSPPHPLVVKEVVLFCTHTSFGTTLFSLEVTF